MIMSEEDSTNGLPPQNAIREPKVGRIEPERVHQTHMPTAIYKPVSDSSFIRQCWNPQAALRRGKQYELISSEYPLSMEI